MGTPDAMNWSSFVWDARCACSLVSKGKPQATGSVGWKEVFGGKCLVIWEKLCYFRFKFELFTVVMKAK